MQQETHIFSRPKEHPKPPTVVLFKKLYLHKHLHYNYLPETTALISTPLKLATRCIRNQYTITVIDATGNTYILPPKRPLKTTNSSFIQKTVSLQTPTLQLLTRNNGVDFNACIGVEQKKRTLQKRSLSS
jgi:hypothetical protein